MTSAAFVTVIKRTGQKDSYNPQRIGIAMKKAFDSAHQIISTEELQSFVKEIETKLRANNDRDFAHIEQIQDAVEQVLMKSAYPHVAKCYIIYRQKRAEERLSRIISNQKKIHALEVTKRNGDIVAFNQGKMLSVLRRVSSDIDTHSVPLDPIITELEKNIFNGIKTKEIEDAMVLSTISFIEREPDYEKIASRLLRQKLYKEVITESTKTTEELTKKYKEAFIKTIQRGVKERIFMDDLGSFDLEKLADHLDLRRDEEFAFIGMRTLCDRYFVRHEGRFMETPQAFWMRIAMGLAIREDDKNARAKEFYDLISSLRYVPSTPTLFHSGLVHPQLSSCYISTISDDLHNIFKCIGDNAQMAKWSGGIGNDWTSVRATNALIKSTNVESQGVIPFLKIANDTTLAINRSGKRRGATCAYLETWHLDIEDFLDLRRNTGDDRRRTHDMNTAVWVPDLFMKRVDEGKLWTLFSPDQVPDLHDLYGSAFEKRYAEYECMADEGSIRPFKKIEALKLWRKMITRLFETGHPWITFKDPCNVRSPQDHVGVVHSSNLCTEITLNNSIHETAVCNLGSINLTRHVTEDGLNQYLLSQTVKTAMRMLDNVIDINFYPTEEAKISNLKHRPVGLGIMGLQDALFILRFPFADARTVEFVDATMEFISYHAILASSELAKERGAYTSFAHSKWDRGILPIDTVDLLEKERGRKIVVSRKMRMNWDAVRESIKQHGMRNSNTMAIAPTATISNVAGCFPCIEPIYKNIYVKSNMSGEFTIINKYLVQDLKAQGLWSTKMLERIKYYDGNIDYIEEIDDNTKALHKETFEIDPIVLIRLTATRAKWIDQSQSHNVFMKSASGKKLHDIYFAAWNMGLKTTYYLRSLGASQIEKSTLNAKEYGFTQKREYKRHNDDGDALKTAVADTHEDEEIPATAVGLACSGLGPDCEACQ